MSKKLLLGGINKKNINNLKNTYAYGFSRISYFLNENKNISEYIQILLNQFSAKNYDEIINKGNVNKDPEFVILYNIVAQLIRIKVNIFLQ